MCIAHKPPPLSISFTHPCAMPNILCFCQNFHLHVLFANSILIARFEMDVFSISATKGIDLTKT